MVSRVDPPPGCEYLGEVKGSTPFGDLGDAHGDALRKAVLRGGNYVAVDLVERPVLLGLGAYVVRGRLFACPLPASPLSAGVQAFAAPLPPSPDGRRGGASRLRARVRDRLHLPARSVRAGGAPQAAAPQAAPTR